MFWGSGQSWLVLADTTHMRTENVKSTHTELVVCEQQYVLEFKKSRMSYIISICIICILCLCKGISFSQGDIVVWIKYSKYLSKYSK